MGLASQLPTPHVGGVVPRRARPPSLPPSYNFVAQQPESFVASIARSNEAIDAAHSFSRAARHASPHCAFLPSSLPRRLLSQVAAADLKAQRSENILPHLAKVADAAPLGLVSQLPVPHVGGVVPGQRGGAAFTPCILSLPHCSRHHSPRGSSPVQPVHVDGAHSCSLAALPLRAFLSSTSLLEETRRSVARLRLQLSSSTALTPDRASTRISTLCVGWQPRASPRPACLTLRVFLLLLGSRDATALRGSLAKSYETSIRSVKPQRSTQRTLARAPRVVRLRPARCPRSFR